MKSPDKNQKNPNNRITAALNFFTEAGLLKKIKRSGWWVVGIKEPESVADHSFRVAVIGHYIAHLENADPYKVMVMCLFNDIHEARINDLHKMGHYYIEFKEAEKKVFKDQICPLDSKVKNELQSFREDYEKQKCKESLIARDADILECLIQAKEYTDQGYSQARKFLKKAPDHLKTKTAKAMWKQLTSWDSGQWWEDVVKFDR
ncbi:MAG: HD family hydrolase [Candidatus Omnitrophica bacterium]|nr:HD family hydrolase [Candidatus Omnitrophota bacterium]MCB9747641.1 HD family hydrolase [Candidatus Omnitrophota bacterium]